jgi:undecaprenyl pyrophosphate phosphatase UppP
MMDLSMLRTMLIPVLLGLFLYRKAAAVQGNLILLAVFLSINGLILYIPQFLPSGNRDSRTLSRMEGLLMGLGGAASVVPGISAVGGMTSIGSVCGVERTYCLDLALMTNMFLNAGLVILDVLAIAENGFGTLSALILLRYVVTALLAFAGADLGIRILRRLSGYAVFGFYCFGLSLFIFILNLIA